MSLIGCDDSSTGPGNNGGDGGNQSISDSSHFNPNINYGFFTDSRNNRSYRTVVIGSKTWMAENLNFAGSGDDIGVCYSNSPDSCAKYGRLYMWNEAMNIDSAFNRSAWGGSNVNHRGVCPAGWHLPNNNDWDNLMEATGSVFSSPGGLGQWNEAGTKLKSQTGWRTDSSSIPGTDEFGFSALPGGSRDGNFAGVGRRGHWWSASELPENSAYLMSMDYNDAHMGRRWNNSKRIRFSVRCLRD